MAILFLDTTSNDLEYAGKILYPEDGRLYSCVVTLEASGRRLSIRGYVGIPILGRTVAWDRVE